MKNCDMFWKKQKSLKKATKIENYLRYDSHRRTEDSSQATFKRKPKGWEGADHEKCEGKFFQAEGWACAKALKLEKARYVWEPQWAGAL